MKKLEVITYLLLLNSIVVPAQQTKLIIKKGNGGLIQKYFVLNSDLVTKHGEYITYRNSQDNYIAKGFYKFGMKDSLWTDYFPNSNGIIKAQGYYKDDKKVGIWKTYKNQNITERYDYDKNKKLQPYVTIIPNYPKSARENAIQGTVTLTYLIHKDCSFTDISVTKSLSEDCDKSAIDALKSASEKLKKYGCECEEINDSQDIRFVLLR